MTGLPYILDELKQKDIDICGISEHWLLAHNSYILENLCEDYAAHVVCCSRPKVLNGRSYGKGGVAIIWKKTLSDNIQTVESDSDRIAAIKVILDDIYVIQAYLPCANATL
jgi:exonuclease III